MNYNKSDYDSGYYDMMLNDKIDINRGQQCNQIFGCNSNSSGSDDSRKSPILNKIFFSIKNSGCEIYTMWFLLVVTILLMLSLLVKNANDEEEINRVI